MVRHSPCVSWPNLTGLVTAIEERPRNIAPKQFERLFRVSRALICNKMMHASTILLEQQRASVVRQTKKHQES